MPELAFWDSALSDRLPLHTPEVYALAKCWPLAPNVRTKYLVSSDWTVLLVGSGGLQGGLDEVNAVLHRQQPSQEGSC